MAEEASDRTVDINYIKSADFREVACDGVIGGPTPNQKLWVAFYTERLPCPGSFAIRLFQVDKRTSFVLMPTAPVLP